MDPRYHTLADQRTDIVTSTPAQQSVRITRDESMFNDPLYTICSDDGRSTVDGVKYKYVNEKYLQLRGISWTEEEIIFTDDPRELDKLPVEHRAVLNGALMLATHLDDLIIEKLATDVSDEFKPWEFRHWFALQKSSETVHSRTYAKAFEYYYPGKISELTANFTRMKTLLEFKNWVKRYMSSDMPVLERIVALTCIEGIVFVTPFSIILNFGIAGKMTGLSDMIKLITPDENIHASVDCHIALTLMQEYVNRDFTIPEMDQEYSTDAIKKARRKVMSARVKNVISDIVNICCKWIDEVQYFGLKTPPSTGKISKHEGIWSVYNMTSDDLKSQVRAVANLYYGRIFPEETIYPKGEAQFVQRLTEYFVLNGNTNLFERRTTDYIKVSTKCDGHVNPYVDF